MKIAQVSSYYPPRLGGMQNVMRIVSERLAKRGHKVAVHASRIGIDTPVPARKNVMPHYLWGFDVANTAIIPSLFFNLLRTPRDAVLHVHAPRPYVAEVVALVAKIRRQPYVMHVHSDIQPLGIFKFLIEPYKKYVWRWSARGADKVIFLSDAQMADMNHRYNLRRSVVIPNGVDEAYYYKKPAARAKKTIELLFVGRLNNQKNIPALIDAVAAMRHPVHLTIAGDGTLHDELTALIAKKHLQNKVTLAGKLVGKPLRELYKKADVYVMASHFEGLSLAMLEAMAASLPVVALDAPGVSEHLDKGGVIVKPRSAKALAKAVDALAADTATRTRLQREAYDYAQSLSWENVIERLEKVYAEVLEQRS